MSGEHFNTVCKACNLKSLDKIRKHYTRMTRPVVFDVSGKTVLLSSF